MDEERKEKTHWMATSEPDVEYTKLTCYRSPQIEAFVNAVERENVIVGINFEGNNICFVLKEKVEEEVEPAKSPVSGDRVTVIKDEEHPFKNKKKHGGEQK